MKEILVDTNVIMRLFDTTSEPAQTAKAKTLFLEARTGRCVLAIAPPVLFEVAWVLRSALKWSNSEVLDVLEAIINWPGVKVFDKDYVKMALSLGRKHNNGFADSYLAVAAKDHNLEVATFNENHFNKLGIELHEMK